MNQEFDIAISPIEGFSFYKEPRSKLMLRDESLVFRFDGYGYPVEFIDIDEHLVDLSWTWEAKRETINSWTSQYEPSVQEYTVNIYALHIDFLQVGFKLKSEQLAFIKSFREWVFSNHSPKRKRKPDAS